MRWRFDRRARMTVLAVVLTAVLPCILAMVVSGLLGSVPRIDRSLHDLLEIAGSCIALVVAVLLFLRAEQDRHSAHVVWVAVALLAMGLMDAVHALRDHGVAWSWLRHGATLTGGTLSALVWLPVPRMLAGRKRLLIGAVVLLTSLASAGLWIAGDRLPGPWAEDQDYTFFVKAINGLGGLGFLLAAVWFFRRYWREAAAEDLVFACQNLLFGLAGFLFGFSRLWEPDWWAWHAARLLAYAILLRVAYQVIANLYRAVALNAQLLQGRVDAQTAELRHREQWYRWLFDRNPDGVFAVDAAGRFILVNPACTAISGYSSAELLEMTFQALCAPDQLAATAAHFQRGVATGQFSQLETALIRKDGRRVELWISGEPIIVENRLSAIHCNVKDITSRQQADERLRTSEQRFRSVLENSLDAAYRRDLRSDRYDYVSPVVQRVMGLPPDQMQAMSLEVFFQRIHPEDRARMEEAIREGMRTHKGRIEYRFLGNDGHYRWLADHFTVQVDAAGVAISWGGIVRDVTAQKRAEDALRESENRYRTLFTSMNEGFGHSEILCNADGKPIDYRYLELNPAWGRLTGIDPALAVGRTVRDVFPAIEDSWIETYGNIALEGGSIQFERYVPRIGKWYRVSAWQTQTGQFGHLLSDITQRKQAEEALRESEERFRTLADGLPLMVWVFDAQAQQRFVNRAFGEFFGVRPEDMTGEKWRDLGHPDDKDTCLSEFDACMLHRRPFHAETRARRADGQWRWLESHGRPRLAESGEFLGYIGTTADVTERKRSEELLRETDRRKDEFLAVLGHELRNPLAALTTGLQLLRSPSADSQEWVKDSLERQTKQLVRLVDDLLDISRISRGTIQLKSQPVNLCRVAETAAEATAALMADKRHAFTLSSPPDALYVLGDPVRLQQIIVNLLTNAAKYTEEGGRLELALSRVQENGVIQVTDNGIGIPAEMQGVVFELFGQVESAMHRPQQGLGIGLGLVKMLVELHKGTVSVASAGEGCGSEFTVRLPLIPTPAPPEGEQSHGQSLAIPRLDVLLVEDNCEAGRLLTAMLAEKGHQVRWVEDGQTALARAAQRQPDLVILDIGLPGISGYEVATRLRQELGYTDTLIVAATGYGQEKDRQRSRDAGIDYHLVKPVEYETLALLVREWLRTANLPGRKNEPTVKPTGHSAAEKPARILVIDDTHAIARITQKMLQRDGHQVEVAFDGPSGIAAARQFEPELILCDLSLPGASGFEVLKAVRAEAALRHTFVAAITGYDRDEDRQRTQEAGFDAHVVKPVGLEQLRALVRQRAR